MKSRACHSSLDGEYGEAIAVVKDASHRAFDRTPVASDGLWVAPVQPVLRILDNSDPLAVQSAVR